MVNVLDFRSGSEGWWFEPCLCRCVVSLDKKLYSSNSADLNLDFSAIF